MGRYLTRKRPLTLPDRSKRGVSLRTGMGQDIDAYAELLDRPLWTRRCPTSSIPASSSDNAEGHATDASANEGNPHTLLKKHGRPAADAIRRGFPQNPETRREPRPT